VIAVPWLQCKVWRGSSRPRHIKNQVSPVVKRRVTSLETMRRSRAANPAEVLICGNAGIRKDLGALSRSSGLPQRPASSRFSSRMFPGEFVKVARYEFGRW